MSNRFDVFLCHNGQDKREVKEIALVLKEKGLSPWLDIWELRPGLSWQKMLEQQINQIQSAAVFIGKNGVGPWQEQELQAFLREFIRRECQVIPVLLASAPEIPQLPTFLEGLTWVDFRNIESEPMNQLVWGITGKRGEAVTESRAKTNRYSNSPSPQLSRIEGKDGLGNEPNTKTDWNAAPDPDVRPFYGRQKILADMKKWIIHERCRLIGVFGIGGIGKTRLVVQSARQNENEFDYVIWRSLRQAPPLDEMLIDCIKFLSGQKENVLPNGDDEKIMRFLSYLQRNRCLIVFDNIESVLRKGEVGEFSDGFESYGELITQIAECKHISCLMLTGREKPQEFSMLRGSSEPVRSISLAGLNETASRRLLKHKGLDLFNNDSCKELIEFYSGNPLALNVISETIDSVYSGNIARYMGQREGRLNHSDIDKVLYMQFERLSSLEGRIMRWLAIELDPITHERLSEIWSSIAQGELDEALQSLLRRGLVDASEAGFTLQNYVMECMHNLIVSKVHNEIMSETIRLFDEYPLLKAQSKEHVRESQKRLLVKPLIAKLINSGTREKIEDKFKGILSDSRRSRNLYSRYTTGNILNMLFYLNKVGWGINLKSYDFSSLTIQQADFHGVELHGVNFSHADFQKSTFTEKFGRIFSVIYDESGMYLAAGTATGEIRLWTTKEMQLIRTFEGHQDVVWSLDFDSAGQTLASGNLDHTVRLWDVNSGECRKVFEGHRDQVRSVDFSNDGLLLASGSLDFTIRLWNIEEEKCWKVLNENSQEHSAGIITVAFNSDSSLLASGSEDRSVKIWNIKTGKCVSTLRGEAKRSIRSVAFSPDSKLLACASDDANIYLWDIRDESCVGVLKGHSDSLCSVIFLKYNGVLWLASAGSDTTIRLWNISTHECIATMTGHDDRIRSLSFNPTTNTLTSGSDDQTVKMWDLSTGKCRKVLQGYTNLVYAIAFTHEGDRLVSGGETSGIQLWNIQTHEYHQTWKKEAKRIRCLTVSPDGKILAVGSENNIVELWNMSSGKCFRTLRGHDHEVWSVIFRNDYEILTGSSDRTIRLWNIKSGKCLHTFRKHTDRIRSIALNSDGSLLASGGFDKVIRLWNLETGDCFKELSGHQDVVWSLAFNHDGNILASASNDKTIRLWDTTTKFTISKTLEGHSGGIFSLALSNDGLLASGGIDGNIKLWEIETGECLRTIHGHERAIRSVTFSNDSRLLASGGDDETIRLWEPNTGECLDTLIPKRPYENMNITGAKGLSEEQKMMLQALGAIDSDD